MNRRARLREATGRQHAILDRLIDERQYFESMDGYCSWLRASFDFHREVQRLLTNAESASELPLGALLERASLLEQDLADLGVRAFVGRDEAFSARLGASEALGMLYVTEGASLGARVLLVRAKKLGLSENRGARNLSFAAHNLEHWRTFLAELEAFECPPADEQMMVAAAQRAFTIADRYWRRQ